MKKNKKSIHIIAEKGDNLLKLLLSAGADIPHSCKGKGKCEKCNVILLKSDDNEEKPKKHKKTVLACLVKVKEPMLVQTNTAQYSIVLEKPKIDLVIDDEVQELSAEEIEEISRKIHESMVKSNGSDKTEDAAKGKGKKKDKKEDNPKGQSKKEDKIADAAKGKSKKKDKLEDTVKSKGKKKDKTEDAAKGKGKKKDKEEDNTEAISKKTNEVKVEAKGKSKK